MKTWKHGIIGIIAIIAIAFFACKDDDGNNDPPQPPKNATITFGDKSITVDYSNSGLTQAQADTVTPKLQQLFTGFATIGPETSMGIQIATMVNRPGFKIVIIPGNSGCGRAGDNMTLGADFVLANDVQGIGESIGPAIAGELFADPETPHEPQPATITQATIPALAFDGAVTIKTGDLYLDADWNAVVAQFIESLNKVYKDGDAEDKETLCDPYVFGGTGVQVVLQNDLTKNWEVKKTLPEGQDVKGTLYIKTGSIGSIHTGSYVAAAYLIMANDSGISVY